MESWKYLRLYGKYIFFGFNLEKRQPLSRMPYFSDEKQREREREREKKTQPNTFDKIKK